MRPPASSTASSIMCVDTSVRIHAPSSGLEDRSTSRRVLLLPAAALPRALLGHYCRRVYVCKCVGRSVNRLVCVCVHGIIAGDDGKRRFQPLHIYVRRRYRFLTKPTFPNPPTATLPQERAMILRASAAIARRLGARRQPAPPSPLLRPLLLLPPRASTTSCCGHATARGLASTSSASSASPASSAAAGEGESPPKAAAPGAGQSKRTRRRRRGRQPSFDGGPIREEAVAALPGI